MQGAPRARMATAAAALSLGFVSVLVLALAARPIDTNDFWWHLEMGEVYWTQGPWPAGGDPLLHTAHAGAPVQHEWLFDVALHLLHETIGFHGLRAVHALAVAGILALAYSLFRRESGSPLAACTATAVFAALGWWRLFQLRPDLVSIPAALGLYRLVIERDAAPSWPRLAAALVLLGVWANAHSLFAIGPALLLAAGLGLALRAALAAGLGLPRPAEPGRAGRLAAALVLGLGVAAANPRGFAQHLTFFTSSSETAIWLVHDEWQRFDPFRFGHTGYAVSRLAWLLVDALGAAFALATAAFAAALWRREPAALRRFDPVRFGLGLAGFAAILVSVRFFWMAAFPLLFLLRAIRPLLRSGPGAERTAATLAAASVAVAVCLPFATNFRAAASTVPRDIDTYLRMPFDDRKFFPEGVAFLRDAGLEGNLFNPYGMGGYLAYRLAPRMRTFIDGRTEHYPADVVRDYHHVNLQRGTLPGESFTDVLDRRGVDVFFGVGVPRGRPRTEADLFTAAALERAPGWILISRSIRHAIYLRADGDNRENLERVSAYYERAGVPFDPVLGLDVSEVIAARPDWAAAHGLVPPDYPELLVARTSGDPRERLHALDRLGRVYAAIGAYREGLATDRDARALAPRAAAPLRRMVYALLRLDRATEAVDTAERLLALDPADRRSAAFLRIARRYARARSQPPDGAGPPPDALINRLPLVGGRAAS